MKINSGGHGSQVSGLGPELEEVDGRSGPREHSRTGERAGADAQATSRENRGRRQGLAAKRDTPEMKRAATGRTDPADGRPTRLVAGRGSRAGGSEA